MSRGAHSAKPLRSVRAILAACALAGSSVSGADAVSASAVENEDAIAAAKRQLEAMKSNAGSGGAGASSIALPRLDVPQLDPTVRNPSPATAESLRPDADPTSKRAENWLVEGMKEREKEQRTAERKRAGLLQEEREDLETSADDVLGRHRDEEVKSKTVGQEDRTSPTTAAANPLDQYLAGWMSPQDYALLRRTLDSASASKRDEAMPGTLAADVSDAASLETVLAGLQVGPSVVSKERFPEKAADNPYLQALAETDRARNALASSVAPAAPPPSLKSPERVVPLPPEPTGKPTVPDFAKPANDNKYFKPLKRF